MSDMWVDVVFMTFALMTSTFFSCQGKMEEPIDVFIQEVIEANDITSCDLGYVYDHKPRITIESLNNR